VKSVHSLSAADSAYLAGLIDGEGTIALSHRHANQRRHLVVSISSTEPELVQWPREAIGAGKITRKRTVSPLHSIGLTYSVSNRQALAVLEQVVPYLRSYKRERAHLVLRLYVEVTPRNGKYTPELAMRRCEFEDVFAAITPRPALASTGRPVYAKEGGRAVRGPGVRNSLRGPTLERGPI